ncbi:PREDICTED: uncharacterized protein LOC108760668 [Trachymyrmex cornetzi]|uniref:Transcription factor IIIC 90kDa subunit N-terminal domain-containing protein n=1 Tax=Trachymyrmex cornetzi TaxID=471704 RepID=A0A195E500_9HYME|nr:PREDICTED: uncharacterized protein LOC108760668 [Trachymyrmex cornetzi]XP_018362244.1 PREDICTED: uncharacterized protein LOC108760668 [Trachymyrmex cornetzi]XP_018362245.1 PREDICTED: uncharacterized protein LOC108760668 [Trachymyrmex cornetzi]XP_018362246.1 PREDICTED: uncharacterized protein LOC108760668 [Trachymyrmex cornetzi]XP_018362247.1 PREDICTED: uncharacterized protein LOC108760668 [Trachymyrmex cornetzi]KYN20265.1 hypothetical protein ALC57_07169 [Trachymyrmex cornetzi]
METEELCSINISPLVGNPFAIQWSSDNHISIITEKGVHVLELQPSPMSPNPIFKFSRSFIYHLDALPACALKSEVDSSIWDMIREEIYSLLMNDVITPKLDGVIDKSPKIVKVSWSPKNLISPGQCILAILNSAGAVELLHKVSNNWYSICDVLSLRLKIIEDEIKAGLNKSNCHENQSARIVESVKKLQACSMTWSKLFKTKDTSFGYFSVAYCNGDIVIWKVLKISDFTKSLQPIFFGLIHLNHVSKVNVLCWTTIKANEHLIVVGYFDGTICGIKLTDKDNSLQILLVQKYVESDCMAVNYLYIIPQDELNIQIFAVKGSFVLVLCISTTGELKNMRYLHIQGFTITGVVPIIAQQFLISTQDSHIFIINILNDLVSINIKSHLPQERVQYFGLAHSPNKVIFVNLTSPNMVYDHLVTREPSIMHIFTLKSKFCDPVSIINDSTNLGNIWDCMEIFRLKAIKAKDPSTIFHPISKNLESLSLYQLQVSMWMTVIMNVCTTKKPIPNMDHIRESKITEALPLIFLHSACTYLKKLMKKSVLSEDQMFTVFLLRQYLEIYKGIPSIEDSKNKNTNQRIQEILNMTMFYSNQTEKCNLCGERIDGIWHIRACPRGHKLPRCCMTLLQITLLEYRVCPICSQIFHPSLEDIYEEPQCQFCDVPILRNSYDFDAENSELYGRNLSLPRIADITIESRDPESKELSEKQSKWNTSQTVNDSVIVNDDDNESDRIMEK